MADIQTAQTQNNPTGTQNAEPQAASKVGRFFALALASIMLLWALLVGIGFSMVGEGGKGSSLPGLLGLLDSTPRGAIMQFTQFALIFFAALAAILLITFLAYLIINARTEATDPHKTERKVKTVISGIALFLTLVGGTVAFLFLDNRLSTFANAVELPPIATEPRNTLNLSAPVTVTFDATGFINKINVRKYKIISYRWDFGDNSTGTGVRVSHEYLDKGGLDGIFTAALEVTLEDAAGNQTQEKNNKITISIKNVKPVVNISATPDKGSMPLTVAFDGSASSDIDGQITKWEWDLDADGEFDDGDTSSTKYTYTANGKYDVSLRLTDNSGDTSIAKRTINVSDIYAVKPSIEIATEKDGRLLIGKSYTFDAGKSVTPNGRIEKYRWSFGDASSEGSGRIASHTYAKGGTYTVTLTIIDEAGVTSTKTRKITVSTPSKNPVSNIATTPVAVKNIISGTAPLSVKFDALPPPDMKSDIVEYAWDFDGDGTLDKFGQSVTNIFADKGTFVTTLTLTDSDDNQVRSEVTVQIGSPGIHAKINADPITGVVPLTVKFDASASTYFDGSIISYLWDFGDGTPKRQDASKISYKYTKIGTYTASVTVVGNDGKRATEKQIITVQNVPVKACFTLNRKESPAPADIVLNANCTSGTIQKYNWDLDGDGLFNDVTGPQVSKIFTDPGTYTVGLEVTDTQGIVDTLTDTITITP